MIVDKARRFRKNEKAPNLLSSGDYAVDIFCGKKRGKGAV
jgi:hypothetical protein